MNEDGNILTSVLWGSQEKCAKQ